MRNKSHKKIMPVYLGDGKTDEDAFLALRGKGITIRVGKNKNSVAGWYVRNQKEVNLFLKWLCNNKPNKTI
jgi:trehalose-6-phosphatase